MRVLLTAFGPFGGADVNSSLEAARLVEGAPPEGVELRVAEIPCLFGVAIDVLRQVVRRVRPDVVIATGQGGPRPDITVEVVAINLDDAEFPDNAGQRPVDRAIVADGPAAYFSTLPVKACVRAVQAVGVPASVSHTSGTWLCNHVAYGLAHLIATEEPGLRGGFVHVPFTPRQATRKRPSLPSEAVAKGLRALIPVAVSAETELPAV